MLSEIKTNLFNSIIYVKEFVFLYLLIILIIYFLVGFNSLFLSLLILFTITSLIFLNIVGRKRKSELDQIKNIIGKIRGNQFQNSEQIIMSRNLKNLQEEIKLMFEKTKNDIEYLKKLERIRTEFLANVSHELRTPIFAIQGYLETLLNGALNDDTVNKYFIDKAQQHTLHLSTLLNDLIDISMIESGEMRLSYRYFVVNEFISPLVLEFQKVAREKGIDLIFSPARSGLQLFGDKNRLRQVLVNLIQNAIKYTEKGEVEILVIEEQKHGRIIVRDTGIGISENDIDRIFERFYRVDKARSKEAGGTGLGLAIVKHLIEAHGSKIEVKSEPGKGSEFSFRLKK
ncbi:MAG: ATP-binding protein [Ignavibacteriaceae bacterium]|nr:ATP-binding protein [Ignavibacteriaceae bacterium]